MAVDKGTEFVVSREVYCGDVEKCKDLGGFGSTHLGFKTSNEIVILAGNGKKGVQRCKETVGNAYHGPSVLDKSEGIDVVFIGLDSAEVKVGVTSIISNESLLLIGERTVHQPVGVADEAVKPVVRFRCFVAAPIALFTDDPVEYVFWFSDSHLTFQDVLDKRGAIKCQIIILAQLSAKRSCADAFAREIRRSGKCAQVAVVDQECPPGHSPNRLACPALCL